uniref:Uncharacterized protein n=1 Tax=viral metagenome TaxID=1070528 RepID=A0A6M3JKY9_9ZZZZ
MENLKIHVHGISCNCDRCYDSINKKYIVADNGNDFYSFDIPENLFESVILDDQNNCRYIIIRIS